MDEVSEMEVLARASLLVRDLAKGIEGWVVYETDDWTHDEHRRVKNLIHQAQLDMFEAGWQRYSPWEAQLQLGGNHNVEVAAWWKRDRRGRKPRWITARITHRFGLRAVFYSNQEPSEAPKHPGREPNEDWT